MRTSWGKRALYSIIGASAGFAYYYFIGCGSGTCPITSNPWVSTAYGGGLGLMMGFGRRRSGKQGGGSETGKES